MHLEKCASIDPLAHDPYRHLFDVGANDVAPQAVGFEKRRLAARVSADA